MFRFVSLLCFALFYRDALFKPAQRKAPASEVSQEIYSSMIDAVDVNEEFEFADGMIDKLLEDNRRVGIEEALDSGKLKVGMSSVEFNPEGSDIKIERKDHKTQIKIHVDEGKVNQHAEVFTNIDGIQQEAVMRSGLKKTISKFYMDQLGYDPNNRKINIEQVEGGLIHNKNATDAHEGKGISIKYYKGIAYHRPDGSTARRHSLRIQVKPHLLDKELTRINVTIGERKKGKTYISVAGVNFLMRDDSAKEEWCKKNPRCNITRKRIISKKLQKPSRSWRVRIPKNRK